MKAIGYIRVSTEEQASTGLSLEYQREKIAAYCTATDIELVGIIEDAGKSGKNMNRAGLMQALDMLKKHQVDALVILKLDRLTRSLRDLTTMFDMFSKVGAALISVQDSFNTDTAAGRFVLNFFGCLGQWERETIAERTKAAMAVKKAKGELVGKVPFGFNLAADGRTLTANEAEQKAVELMKSLRSAGRSFRAICAELTERGISTKSGGAWQAATVRNICLAAG